MKCRVCSRQARGFGCLDVRFEIADPRRYPTDWVFCSIRCQKAFLSGSIKPAPAGTSQRSRRGRTVIDPTDVELAAMRACLPAFGEAAAGIGFDKPLGAYSEAEALRVVEAIVTGYTEAMVAHHEASRHPPVRGLLGGDQHA